MSTSPVSDLFLLSQPFGLAPAQLLSGWWRAAQLFCSTTRETWLDQEFAERVSACFGELGSIGTNFDPHLTSGFYETLRSRRDGPRAPAFTRPYSLLLNHFRHEQVQATVEMDVYRGADTRNRTKQYLFSPLYFLRQMLTSPEFPASDSYAHAVVRAEIFAGAISFAKVTKAGSTGKREVSATDAVREFIDFDEVAKSLQKVTAYAVGRAGDTFYAQSPSDYIVGHLLASRGLAVLTFAPRAGLYPRARRNERPLIGRDTFLDSSNLPTDEIGGVYEFRVLDEIGKVPSATELVNELDGMPIPIPGADVVFARGLRSTSRRGVVGRVSGASGAGKTSFALALALSLMPLGTTTKYLSCEEEGEDLEKRIYTLAPPFVRRMSIFPKSVKTWFSSFHLDMREPEANRGRVREFVHAFRGIYEENDLKPSQDAPPGLFPFLVVLDGVHELVQHNTDVDQVVALRELVDELRTLGAFVLILTAATDDRALRELDYTVDFVVTMEHEPRIRGTQDPVRNLVLHKTRLQYARSGAHVLHISKRDGVKVYPSASAQLDTLSLLQWKPLDKRRWFDFLQAGVHKTGAEVKRAPPQPLVRIFDRSHVLVSGRGSTGKASFALKMVAKPLVSSRSGNTTLPFYALGAPRLDAFKDPRRILVVSFLYPTTYYETVLRTIRDNLTVDSMSKEPNPNIEMDVLSLYPGNLPPEVLLAKILGRFERASLEGIPYSAVVIDGLHNIFLQFPLIQDSITLWPVLLEILRILGVTVVTTHTQFQIKGMETATQFQADVEAALRRIGPLLQSLVNSADFYFDLSQENAETRQSLSAFRIDVVTALGQQIRRSNYFWNRDDCVVEILPEQGGSGAASAGKPSRGTGVAPGGRVRRG